MKKTVFESPTGHSYIKAEHPSGLQIYLMEMPQHSSAYAVFGTRYGSIDTRFSKNGGEVCDVPEGIAHFLEHKLFESEDGDAFTRFAQTGASANAYTSFDRTCYLFSCTDKFIDNLDILLDFVQSPYFTAQTVQKEQGIIGQEIRMYDDSPSWRVMFNMLREMYTSHPVRIDIAGTVESIAEITDDLLYKCYNTFYNPSNMFLCIAGNFDAGKALEHIERGVRESEPVSIERGEFSEGDGVHSGYVEQQLDVALPIFCYGFKQKITSPQRSLKTKLCVSLLLELICGEASPLYARLIRQGLINDEFETEYFTGHGYAAVIFEGESRDPERVAEEIRAELRRIKEDGIDKKQFSAAKCSLYGEAIRRFDSVNDIGTQLVECAITGNGLFDELKLLKALTPDSIMKRLGSFDENASVLSVIKPRSNTEE